MYTRCRKNEIREYSRNALFIVKNFYELTWQSLIQNCYPVLECQEVCNMYQSFPYYVQRKYYRCTYFALRLVYLMRPCQGGSHVARLNFKTSHVGVYKCLSLIVGLAEGGCLLSRFHFTRCRYFLSHVACRNLPW